MANEILIQPPRAQLTREGPMTVPVTLHTENPIKVRGIHARFHGAEETKATYTTTSTDSKGRTTTQTHTAVECVSVVEQTHLLAGDEKGGFISNALDAAATLFGGGQHHILPAGDHEFAVDVEVPPDAPPTHVGDRSRVFYELTVRADIPLGRDLTATQPFLLAPLPQPDPDMDPVLVRFPDDAGKGFWDALFAPNVRMELALATNTAFIGETIEGAFSVETAQPIRVRAIRVRLTGHERSTAHGHTDAHTYNEEPIELTTEGSIEGSFAQKFSLPAEISGPLTARGTHFTIDWYVQIELDVPWARDPKIGAPIRLACR